MEVAIGCRVKLKQQGPQIETEFEITRPGEHDYRLNRIPSTAPLATAVLGHRIGDVVEEPGMPIRWMIVEIS